VDIPNPPLCSVLVEKDGDGLILTRQLRSSANVSFLVVLLALCIVLLIWIARDSTGLSTVQRILLEVVSGAGWLMLFCRLLWRLFGVERLRLDADGLEYLCRLFVTLNYRRIPRGEITAVIAFESWRDAETGKVEYGLKIMTRGRPLRCLRGVDAADRKWLVNLLEERLPVSTRKESAAIEGVRPAQPAIDSPNDNALPL
jgi:hypothetical protein